MSQADLAQATTKKTTRRSRSQIEREMKMLSAFALVFLIPGFIMVFIMPPLGVILMTIGGFIWIQKDAHYVSELQSNQYAPDKD